jgi:hypothetical protein
MSGGVVTGGWNFVVAAYTVTFSILAIYGVTLVTRFREESRRAAEERESK